MGEAKVLESHENTIARVHISPHAPLIKLGYQFSFRREEKTPWILTTKN